MIGELCWEQLEHVFYQKCLLSVCHFILYVLFVIKGIQKWGQFRFTPFSGIVREPMLGVLFNPFPICFRDTESASPAIETGLCFFFLRLTSASGSILCCQQVTLAKNPVGDVTDSLRWGTDFVDDVLFISDWEEVDFKESLLLISDLEEVFFTSILRRSDLEEDFFTFFSPFLGDLIWRGTDDRR